VQRWVNGQANHGLAILPEIISGNDDGIEIYSSEARQIMFRPVLEVEWVMPARVATASVTTASASEPAAQESLTGKATLALAAPAVEAAAVVTTEQAEGLDPTLVPSEDEGEAPAAKEPKSGARVVAKAAFANVDELLRLIARKTADTPAAGRVREVIDRLFEQLGEKWF
jgi:hypothetical protein